MDRDDAIRELERHGFIATKRDWAMGETIVVIREDLRLPDNADGIVVYRDNVWLRREGELWALIVPDDEFGPMSLTEAIDQIRERFDRHAS